MKFTLAFMIFYMFAMLSDAFWTAAFGALVALMLGYWNWQTARAVRLAAEKAEAKADKLKEAVDNVGTKAEVIVGHVNSEKTAAQGREATLQAENVLLRQIIAEKKEAAALLAQAAATHPIPLAVPGLTELPAPEGDLKKIEVNTAETAANTARTEQKVQELL